MPFSPLKIEAVSHLIDEIEKVSANLHIVEGFIPFTKAEALQLKKICKRPGQARNKGKKPDGDN